MTEPTTKVIEIGEVVIKLLADNNCTISEVKDIFKYISGTVAETLVVHYEKNV